jgi:hypothetical protein
MTKQAPKVLSPENKVLTLKQAVAQSGLSMIYIRRAINEGKLPASKEQIGSTKVYRNVIKVADFEAWRASRGTRSRREDGRNKFDLYATPEEYETLAELCKANDLECPIKRSNAKGKNKAEATATEA